MEMLGTLSRSGGSEDGVGDGLLAKATQEKFYGWIEGKVSPIGKFVIAAPLLSSSATLARIACAFQLEKFYNTHPTFRTRDPGPRILFPQTDGQIEQERAGKEALDVILLHFRESGDVSRDTRDLVIDVSTSGKIREGILASRRMDAFSVKG
jgi:hypothetical protein